MNVYLDLNIFDRIEKKDNLSKPENEIYTILENLILNKQITVPYSNAHLNDLFRGFQKNPDFIDKHLANIEKLTNNLCICQYWGRKETTWHYREIKEFFKEKITEWEFEPNSFDDLFSEIPNFYLPFKLIPLPNEWKLTYQKEPMFGVMYPKSRTENNMYALMEDIFNLQSRLKSDYSLYRSLKQYIINGMHSLKNNKEILKAIKGNFNNLPKHLYIFEIADLYGPKSKTSKNESYSKVIETFYKYDLKGYKTDGNFNNMFDDALHTFYGAQCDFFVTNDDRCKYKAEKTYKRLKIKTIVINAKDYKQIKTI